MLNRTLARVVPAPGSRFFLSIFTPLAVIYGATASWQLPQDPDVLTIAVSAWHMGNTGSPFLFGYEQLTEPEYSGPLGSFRMAPGGPVSQYPPGASLLAAPLYAIVPGGLRAHTMVNSSEPDLAPVEVKLPSFWPATLVAVLSTAAAMGFLGLVFLTQGTPREAWIGALIAGLGTSAWSVASGQLFMHGPGMMWIALGLLLATRSRFLGSGLALAAGVLTRPHSAVIAAAVGLGHGIQTRSLTPVVRVGLTSVAGVAALLGFNYWVYGRISITGGYSGAFTERLLSPDPLYLPRNLVGGLFDPRQGFLVLSPFLALLVPGLIHGWRRSEPWVRSATVGGLVYLLLQFAMNRYNPGNSTLYRYPLEALTASAPLWFATYMHWIRNTGRRARFFVRLVAISIFFQALGVGIRMFS